MEGLRKLEQIQRIILFMRSRGIIDTSNHGGDDNTADSDRFLANLFLLLMQPCGKLDMSKKCQLMSEHFSKISELFLEEASQWLGEKGMTELGGWCDDCFIEGNKHIDNPVLLTSDNEADCDLLVFDFGSMAAIGFDAMQRANSTLEDFCRSYFMFHEMDAKRPESIFQYLPMLSFTESYIYQLDSLNEKILQLSNRKKIPILNRGSNEEANGGCLLKLRQLFRTDPFRPLVRLLQHQGLLTDRISEEFRCGVEYWSLERKLCCALTSKKEILIGDVMKAIHLKSFDYRVLNLLLYQLRGEKVNELHMEFLSVSEFLVEVSDDLFDYEDDILENNFNVLRMLVGIFGASVAPTMLAKFITEAEEKYDGLLKALDPKLSAAYKKRCEEATKEGGKMSGSPLGTWSLPPIVEDEDLYRYENSNSNSKPSWPQG